jgi:hydrogenase maturation protein HypF
MVSYHIHIRGQVQGVGFRPYIFNLAKKMNIVGTVSNGSDGVHIQICAIHKKICDRFLDHLLADAPPRSKILSIDITETENHCFTNFNIIHSESKGDKNVHLSPDFGICEKCAEEVFDSSNRRFQYPFITCTQCGPRLSVVHDIPYDRECTSMSVFTMCPECQKEYDNPDDRRYFSQTNSCATCGVQLKISSNPDIIESDIINYTVQELKEGKIVAVKGIGGYLLLCDASNSQAIQTLRARKKRPKKPFALLYPNVESIKQDVTLGENAINEISHTAFPIILAYTKTEQRSNVQYDDVAPKLSQLGVMLPNSPLLSLISVAFGGTLVATSGNISGSPIIYDDVIADEQFKDIADFILSHNRDIVMPQDDSVIRFSPFYHYKIVIRRSRGYAPTYWPSGTQDLPSIFCAGADMKSAFLLASKNNIYISQFLGDLSAYDGQVEYKKVLTLYIKVSGIQPQLIVFDKHPGYFSSTLAIVYPDAKTYSVQHHKAHFFACLYENDLISATDSIMGIIWDGVGYGDDGQMWGGEFFMYENKQITRTNHISYFDYLLGDKMSLQPRLSALSLCKNIPNADELLVHKFSEREWTLYKKMIQQDISIKTSSMGRVFDAVASLLRLGDVNSYEGESAMLLEDQAYQFFKEKGINWNESYNIAEQTGVSISIASLFMGILEDILLGKEVTMMAAKFHLTLVRMIDNIAKNQGVKGLVFSGGVFQNGLLVDLIHHHLSPKYNLYFHKYLSPNDENIALGQMAYFMNFGYSV